MIDYNEKITSILESHEVEELTFTIQAVAEANRIGKANIKTFALRNRVAGLIHEKINVLVSIDQAKAKADHYLQDQKAQGLHDQYGIDGINPNDEITSNRDTLNNISVRMLDDIIGSVNVFFETYQVSIAECLTWTSTGQLGRNGLAVLNQCQDIEYSNIMAHTDMAKVHNSIIQQLSYKKQGLAEKLKTATQPVKQYDAFEKAMYNELQQTKDQLAKLETKRFQKPITK